MATQRTTQISWQSSSCVSGSKTKGSKIPIMTEVLTFTVLDDFTGILVSSDFESAMLQSQGLMYQLLESFERAANVSEVQKPSDSTL